ncbi:MAG: hypothetical protein AB1757_28390 [Acidobacteriota bacterium]
MKNRKLWCLALILLFAIPVAAQEPTSEFKDAAGRFKITLIGDWKPVTYDDAVGRSRTEFVYGDRSEGLLKITKEKLNGETLTGKVHTEQENLRIYRVGFERVSTEHFDVGKYDGMRFAFFSTDSGRKTASAFYYIQEGDSVWVLRFTGKRGVLDTIRNLTDRMARSFTPLGK